MISKTNNNQIGKKLGLCICAALTIVWMIVIFRMSARSGDDSTGMSLWVGRLVCELVIPGFRSWSAEAQQYYAELIDFPVRKLAHMAEYAVLGALVYADVLLWPFGTAASSAAVSWTKISRGSAADGTAGRRAADFRCGIAFLFCVLYAASDELHQRFVPGRSGQLRDVLIDSIGVAIGVLGVWLLMVLYRKLRGEFE